MAKRKNPTPKEKGPRVNRQIDSQKVRIVIDGEGVRTLDTRQALAMAEEQGLDLVEVSGNQDPPICKIIDFGKWKFEQQKKKKGQAKNQHVIHIKEIKMRPKIGQHDYEIKKKHAMEFLNKGDKVKVSLRFRGREITHPELGMKVLEKLAQDVSEIANIEIPPKMEGKQIVMVLGVKPGVRKKPAGGKKEEESSEPAEPVAT